MSKDFPKLKDTAYPYLDNASVAPPEVSFDYSVWTPGQRIYVCNVPWSSDYSNVVDWTEESRDDYFKSLEPVALEPATASRRVDNVVRINLPYADALRYNYLYTDYFPYPVPGGNESRRLYYFIAGYEELAPNTTALVLEQDLWTTYRPGLVIDSAMLERGHAPADSVSVDRYFTDPSRSFGDLGVAEDVAPTGSRISGADNFTIFKGEKALAMSLPVPPDALSALLSEPGTSGYSEATFADTSARYGYRYRIDGLRYGVAGVADYSGLISEAAPVATSNGNTPGTYLYAIEASSVFSSAANFARLAKRYPGLIAMCEAAFIVPAGILETRPVQILRVDGFSLTVSEVYDVLQPSFEHALSPDDFETPSRYAKGYTWPYRYYTFDLPSGASIPIKIEEVSGDRIIIDNMISLSAPAIAWAAAAVNIESGERQAVEWTALTGSESVEFWNTAPWAEFMHRLEIPTYALRLPAYIHDALLKARDARAMQDSAEVSYHNAARIVNTDLENVKDANATNTSNVASAGETSTSNVNIGCAAASANTNIANEASEDIVEQNNRHMSFEAIRDNTLNTQLTNAQNEAAAITTSNNGMGSMAGGITSGILAGAAEVGTLAAAGSLAGPVGIAAGAAIGLGHVAIGALQSGIGVAVAQANSQVSINLSSAQASAMNARNSARATASADTSSYNTVRSNNSKVDETDTSNAASRAQNANNVALANLQASRNESTVNANTQYSRNANLQGEQDNLNLAVRNYSRGVLNSAMAAPSRFGADSGDPTFDALAKTGYSVRMRSADDNALRTLEYEFDRYGYRYGRVWDFGNVLTDPEHPYSYIEAGEVYKWSGDIPLFAREALFAVLSSGVTVWNRAEEIGKVAPYER